MRNPVTVGGLPVPWEDNRILKHRLVGGVTEPAEGADAVGSDCKGAGKYGCNSAGLGDDV